MDMDKAYDALLKDIKEYIVLSQIEYILDWDFETYMPPKGVEQRSEELAMMATLRHERIANPKIGELIQVIKTDPNYSSLSEEKKREIALIERKYNRQSKIPKELVEKIAKHIPIAIDLWKKAKKVYKKNPQIHLEKWVLYLYYQSVLVLLREYEKIWTPRKYRSKNHIKNENIASEIKHLIDILKFKLEWKSMENLLVK